MNLFSSCIAATAFASYFHPFQFFSLDAPMGAIFLADKWDKIPPLLLMTLSIHDLLAVLAISLCVVLALQVNEVYSRMSV